MFRSAQNVKSAFGIKFLKISEKNSILKNGTFYQRYRWWYLLYGPDKTGISLDETRRSKIEISWHNCSFKKIKKRKKIVLCTEIAKHFEFLLYFWKKNDLTRSVQVALTVNYTLLSKFSCHFCHEIFHLFGAYYFYICWFQTFFRENGPILKKMDHVIRDNKNFRQSRIFQNL